MTNTLPIRDIHVGERVREAVKSDVEALAQSIASEGLINPITVRFVTVDGKRAVQLVAGLHRLEACKLLGHADIAVTWQHRTEHPEVDDLNALAIECEENLKRNELVEGMRALFVKKRLWVEDKRLKWKALQEAKARNEAAKKGKDKKEKEAAAVALKRAQQAWDGVEDATTGKGTAGPLSVGTQKVAKGARDSMAKATGLTVDQIHKDVTLVNTHGEDVLKLASQVELDSRDGKLTSRSELAALARLKTEYPEQHALVLKSWSESQPKRPSTVLAEIGKREKSDARQEARETPEGAVEALLAAVSKVKSELQNVIGVLPAAAKAGNMRDIPQKIRTMRSQAEEMRSLLVNIRKGLKEA